MSVAAERSAVALVEAERMYASALERMRESYRHGHSWEIAAVTVVNGMGEAEASAVLGYLRAQTALAEPDVTLANAVAKRLGLVIEWRRIGVAQE